MSIKILLLLIILTFNNVIINKLIRISLMRHNIIISSNSFIHKYKFVGGYRYILLLVIIVLFTNISL